MQQQSSHYGYRSAKSLSLFPVIGLGLQAVCSLLSGVVGIAQIISPDTVMDLDDAGAASVWHMLQGIVYLLEFPIYVATGIGFLIWVHRTHGNLEFLRPSHLEFTPGWAVGWWFIPFANLVKPFQAVREIWWESDPDVPGEASFLSSSLHSAPTYMGIWWGTWIISNVLSNVTSNVYDPDRTDNVTVTGTLFLVTALTTIIAAVFAIKVVRDITERQEQRFKVIGMVPKSGPPPPPTFDAAGSGFPGE